MLSDSSPASSARATAARSTRSRLSGGLRLASACCATAAASDLTRGSPLDRCTAYTLPWPRWCTPYTAWRRSWAEAGGAGMKSPRQTAVLAGAFFIIAAVAAMVGLVLYGPVLNDPHYVATASGGDTRVLAGAFSEVILAISVIGTAVTLFPVVKRQSEGIALGYVAGRVVEAVVIIVGIMSLLSVVTLHDAADANASTLVVLGRALVAVHDWTF